MDVREKILIVDDSDVNLLMLGKKLTEYDVLTAKSGTQMRQILEEEKPSLILMDVIMPEENGFQLAKAFSGTDKNIDIPIIFITAKTGGEDVAEGFESGGYDYIKKPFDLIELKARIQSTLRKKRLEKELRYKTITDPLTGVYNRTYFFDVLAKNIEYVKRNKTKNFSVSIVDIDFFKEINDSFGHMAGDYILQQFVSVINSNIRSYDVLARYGGEEFILLLFDCSRSDTNIILGRIKDLVEAAVFRFAEKNIKFTFSGGISEVNEVDGAALTMQELIKLADERLYSAKKTGRNRIILN